MTPPLLQGELVRLVAINTSQDADLLTRWTRDTEYWRLLDATPARAWTQTQGREFVEREFETERPETFAFSIRARDDDRLVGEIDLGGVLWTQGDAFVGIGIGERELWGKWYGTDAMRVLLRFAFQELNLHRVSLTVYGYNLRAQRAYAKIGFQVEGRARQVLLRDGQRHDVIFMSILQNEWQTIYG